MNRKTLFKSCDSEQRRRNQVVFSLSLILLIAVVSCLRIPGQDLMQKVLWTVLAAFGFIGYFGTKLHMHLPRFLQLDNTGSLCLLGWFVIPFLLVMGYSLVYCSLTGDQLGTAQQAVTTTGYIAVDAFMVIWLLGRYGNKSLTLLSVAVIVSYALTFVIAAVIVGPQNILLELQKSGQRNLFESHDVGTAVVPLLFVHTYCAWRNKDGLAFYLRRHAPVLIGLLAVLVLCGKRSAYLSLAAGGAVSAALYLGRKNLTKWAGLICAMGFAVCFLYVICIRTGVLDFLAEGFGTLSDRYYVWKQFDSQYSISPLSLGHGFGYVHRYMESGIIPGIVTAYGYLHNSTLQIYIEAGFLGFLIWFAIYYAVLPVKSRRIGGKVLQAFVVISVVAMTAMFTIDNTLTYPVYQISLLLSIGFVYQSEVQHWSTGSTDGAAL